MKTNTKPSSPPLTPEAHENKLISLALQQAEKHLKDGKASSQIVNHFLQQSTKKKDLEIEKLRLENALLQERIKTEKSNQNLEAMYDDVIKALKSYTVNSG